MQELNEAMSSKYVEVSMGVKNLLDEVKDSYVPRVNTIKMHKDLPRQPFVPKKTQQAEMIAQQRQMDIEKKHLEKNKRKKA